MSENIERPKEKMNFEAKQNATGFFSLPLKINKRNSPQNRSIKINLFFRILVSIVFIIFAMWFIFNNAYFYCFMCLFLLFLIANNQRVKKLTIKFKEGFSVEFFNPEKYKNKTKKISNRFSQK